MASDRGNLSRKMAAITHADVTGSTALVQLDEALTHERINEAFKRFSQSIGHYGGTVHEIRGDALIAEFPRASDAVCAALAFQDSHNQILVELDDAISPKIRIGVSLGEVIFADGQVTGAGVVLAQRVEQLAEPGGLCITAAIHEALPQHMPFDQYDLGEQEVKGFEESVRVYRVALKPGKVIPPPENTKKPKATNILGISAAVAAIVLVIAGGMTFWFQPWAPQEKPASVERMAFPLPDKPSIAVLPFTNMSDDAKQEYFVDGMTEDLITDLSKLSGLFVIARNTVFTYKDKPVKVSQVAEELGVRYVLEGSVRRAGNQVRINAQLIDATTGGHLWAERYDGTLSNVFTLQDYVTEKIVAALAVNLTDAEKAAEETVETSNPEAYDAFLKGWAHYQKQTPEDFSKAREYLEQVIELDPDYSRAYAALAALYWEAHIRRWAPAMKVDEVKVKEKAYEYRDRALANPTPLALVVASDVLMWLRKHDEAITQTKLAIDLAPNDAFAHLKLAAVLVFAGRPQDALEFIDTAARLDPHGEARQLYIRGLAEFGLDRFDAAVASLIRALELNPDFAKPMAVLVAAYGHQGQQDAVKLLEPYGYETWTGSVFNAGLQFPYKHETDRKRLEEGLRKAGMKDVY